MNVIESRFYDAFLQYASQNPVFSVYHNSIDYNNDAENKTSKIADCNVEFVDENVYFEHYKELYFSIKCNFFGIEQQNIQSVLLSGVLRPQYQTPSYTVDFMLSVIDTLNGSLGNNLGIEIDGHEWHEKSKDQAASDKKRERELLMNNISIIRYTGSEIYTNPERCIEESLKIFVAMCYWKIHEHEMFYEFMAQREQEKHREIMEQANGK